MGRGATGARGASLPRPLGSAIRVKASGGRITIGKANEKSPAVYAAVAGLNLYGMSVRIEPD